MDLRGQDVLVVGTKRSGLGAIELLRKHGARVRAMDALPLAPAELAPFDASGVPVVLQAAENIADHGRLPSLIVLSPAVPFDAPFLSEARQRGVPVIGEVELASYYLQGPVIGITGSNGKTTTTALTGHVLKECGISCQVGGNIGKAVTTLIESGKPEQWNVLELSSFQLESIHHFRADIAACLNVTPDHLDRHHTFDEYAAAKGRLFQTQGAADCAVLNYDDATCRSYGENSIAQLFWFSSSRRVPAGIWLDGDHLSFDDRRFMQRAQIGLPGLHNVENVMAAALMAHLAGAELYDIPPAVESFPGVEHRLEFVRELDGVRYFNDSKATNVDATIKAIQAFPGNLWIILGGKDKASDYAPLRDSLHQKAKSVLLIGAAAPLIRKALEGAVPMADCGSLAMAVQHARANAQSGDIVLLAPACASFDQFQNFEHRGSCFKQLVKGLL